MAAVPNPTVATVDLLSRMAVRPMMTTAPLGDLLAVEITAGMALTAAGTPSEEVEVAMTGALPRDETTVAMTADQGEATAATTVNERWEQATNAGLPAEGPDTAATRQQPILADAMILIWNTMMAAPPLAPPLPLHPLPPPPLPLSLPNTTLTEHLRGGGRPTCRPSGCQESKGPYGGIRALDWSSGPYEVMGAGVLGLLY